MKADRFQGVKEIQVDSIRVEMTTPEANAVCQALRDLISLNPAAWLGHDPRVEEFLVVLSSTVQDPK